MCKYCKLKTVSEQIGEKTNGDSPIIARIKDGSQIFVLYLWRSIVESTNEHSSELVLDLSVETECYVHTVKDKSVKIKYCPFCGEEL